MLEAHRLLHRHGHIIVWLIHELISSEILIVLFIVLEILRILHPLEVVRHVVRRSKGPCLVESILRRLEIGWGSEGRLKLFLSNFHTM